MNEEFESDVETAEPEFSAFWPLLILILGLLLWSAFQAFSTVRQGLSFNSDLTTAAPMVKAADDAQTKLYSLAQDLLQTGTKDTYAAEIVREANIKVNGNQTGTEPAPAPSTDGTK